MRRLLGWIGGAVGGVAAYRWLRRSPVPEAVPAAPEADERADELRAKLAESRADEPVVEAPPVEPMTEEPAAEPESPDERRRRVHDEGRAALDEMKPD